MSHYPWREGSVTYQPQGPREEPGPESVQAIGQGAGQPPEQAQERTARCLRVTLLRGAEQARVLVAEGLSRVASALRSSAPATDTPARRFAENLERGASYLRQTDVHTMQRDLAGVVKQHPVQALGVAFVAGLLVGRRFGQR